MSVNNSLDRLRGSDSSANFSSQIKQLNHDTEEIEDRVYQLFGEALVKIGENTQLLRLEQLELTKEKIALKHQITQLKRVHLAEWEALLQDFNAKMGVVSDKIKSIVDRFKLVEELFLDPHLPQLRINLRSSTSHGKAVEGYYKFWGQVQVMFEYDACRSDEGCDSVFTDWLKLTLEDATNVQKLDYPSDSRRAEGLNQIAILPQESTWDDIIKPLELTLTLNQTALKFRKFLKVHVEKYQALEVATATMRAANVLLKAKKELMREVHPAKLESFKLLLAIRFTENLQKAKLYLKTEESFIDPPKFHGKIDPLNEPHLLTDSKIQWMQESYTEEIKLIQGLFIPLISTLEAFILEYGKAIMEPLPTQNLNDKTIIDELVVDFETKLQIIRKYRGETNVPDDIK